MGFCSSAPIFCMSTDTVADMAKAAFSDRHMVTLNLFEMEAECRAPKETGPPSLEKYNFWKYPPIRRKAVSSEEVDVYLEVFI